MFINGLVDWAYKLSIVVIGIVVMTSSIIGPLYWTAKDSRDHAILSFVIPGYGHFSIIQDVARQQSGGSR